MQQKNIKMEPMIISNLNVCSDVKTIHLFKDITTDLKKTFQNLSCSLKPIKIYYGTKYTIVVYSEETILNTINIILILDPASIQYDITTTTNKIANTKYTIEQVFTKIPKLLYRPNIQYRFLNCTFQNNKLIFLTTSNKSEILNTIQRTANAMVFGAYMPCRSIQLQTPETNERNVFNCPQVVKEEDDAKKKTEEQDEISYIRQSKPPSPLKLSPLEFSDSTVHENVSDKTYQSKVSVADALSLIKQKVTEDHIILIESEFVNIKNAFGRISAQAVTSCNDLPRFQVATKIEYAVEVEKEINEIEMKTHESSESSPIILDPNTSVLVKKGERISLDAATAAILKKDDSTTETGMSNNLTSCTIKNQQNVTLPGSNIKKDKLIIDKCTHILSREVMFLKTSNHKKIKVYEKLSIGVMVIGNETKLELNCNKLTLDLLLKENKFDFESVDLRNTNNPEDIIQNIAAALEHVDLLVTTGYFSDKDYVKNILKNHFKAVFLFENVDMKPGKSTAFASCYFKNKPKVILCLPEKPTSVLITAYVFFLPLVKWIHFNFKEDWSTINVAVDQTLLLHSRPRYVWTNLSWDKKKCFPKVRCENERSINYFLSNSDGNALLILPPKTLERSTLEISSRVPALPVKFPFSKKIYSQRF